VLKLIKSYDYKRLKTCVLSFLLKLVRDEISLACFWCSRHGGPSSYLLRPT